MYEKVSTDLNLVEREKKVEKFWKDQDIFRKSMKLRVIYLFVLSCIFAYANPANGIHDVILKGESHDNTVFGITLGKSTFEEVTKIFKGCNFQEIPKKEFEKTSLKKYGSKNCVAHFNEKYSSDFGCGRRRLAVARQG